ncbi:ABC transporter permease [Agrobacterium rosae]|uniref:ABC transporter permease n=1 Tax=Agrobacterium rosae TaxID=1972867 RepID=A0AAE5S0H5_9HYPH|nr:ABC transporter permease [Agrobacterium rosae]KAA3512944.1 ABC transporter permease [Agrobacterium rosae]KAA3521569.1 ABC transporter permease [Agrobacterium rosae]MCM2432552.1 ABC transporter permease [Agrobacterium rosae]MDX8328377.1 ABC transporter permease [Agrobacterium rosae]MQB48494.1 ABC transporter permease [Agrobacterium rosae]
MSIVETSARPRRGKKSRANTRLIAVLGFIVTVLTTFLGLMAVTFFIGRVIPIDPALAIVGDRAPAHVVERVREELGLNLPLWEQFFIYIKQALSGNFGNSVLTTNPVFEDIKRFFPATIELATIGTLIGAVFGIPLGVLAAVKRGSIIDQIVRIIGLVGYSVPIFWLGLLALLVFYAKLNWVAYPGRMDIVYEFTFTPVTGFYLLDAFWQGQWDVLWDLFRHIILPAGLLGYFSLAYISRMTRSFMLNELSQEYIVAARAKGLSETRIIWFHALRNAAVPLLTVIVLSYAGLLEGSVLTETIFSWPGLGLYITNSLQNADMNAVLGGTIVIGAVFISINLLSDLLYRTLDPRTRSR